MILNPLSVRPLTAEAIVTAPDITASLCLVAPVPGAIELFGPRIVSALSILKFSVYVPALTLMVEPAPAASTAAWIVVKVQPLAQTVRPPFVMSVGQKPSCPTLEASGVKEAM